MACLLELLKRFYDLEAGESASRELKKLISIQLTRGSMLKANSWITDNFAALSGTPLGNIVIPGAHDAGMSELHGTSVNIAIMGPMTKTQSLRIENQIVVAGARYLDVRFVHYIANALSDVKSGHYTAHYQKEGSAWVGLLGQSIEHVCDDLLAAMGQIGNQEVILLEITHGAKLTEGGGWEELSASEQAKIIGYVLAKLGPFMYSSIDPNLQILAQPLSNMISPTNPIPQIVLWNSDDSFQKCGFSTTNGFFGKTNIDYYDPYFDIATDVPEDLVSNMESALIKYAGLTPPQNPFLMPWHCKWEPGASSLKDLATSTNRLFTDAIARWWDKGIIKPGFTSPNIVDWDFMSDKLIEMFEPCVELNFGRVRGFVSHVVLDDTSYYAPALASFNNQLIMAWCGVGNNYLNIEYSTNNDRTFGNQYTSSQTAGAGPALCVFNKNLYIAWTGIGNNKLNVAQVLFDNSNMSLTNQVTLSATSSAGPALATFGGQLYVAWTGENNNSLNVMNSSDGQSFDNQYTSTEQSACAPALCAHGQNLYIAWTGTPNSNLNIAQVTISDSDITGFSNEVVLDEQSPQSPALASLQGELYIVWQGVPSNNELNLLRLIHDGQETADKYTSKDTTIQGVGISAHGDHIQVAWTGVNNNQLNVVRYRTY